MTLLAIGVAGYAVFAYTAFPLGDVVHPEMRRVFTSFPVVIYTHIFLSFFALTLGPFQFSSNIRAKYLRFHRVSGRLYLGVGVLFGGLAGLFMAQHAFGGIVSQVGFSCMALVWLFTGMKAFQAIRINDVERHRSWMIRNYAVTFSAVTLRLYLGMFSGLGMEFESVYPFLAWISWMPNLIVAESIILLSRRKAVLNDQMVGPNPA